MVKRKDENLTGDDIQEGNVYVFNITAPNMHMMLKLNQQ